MGEPRTVCGEEVGDHDSLEPALWSVIEDTPTPRGPGAAWGHLPSTRLLRRSQTCTNPPGKMRTMRMNMTPKMT